MNVRRFREETACSQCNEPLNPDWKRCPNCRICLDRSDIKEPGRNPTTLQSVFRPRAGDQWTDKVTGMVFLYVPGGTFLMGSDSPDAEDDEKPAHSVSVTGFWMAKYPVTQDVWKYVVGWNRSDFKAHADSPVSLVSWRNTQEFLRLLNLMTGQRFRLPTEAEWEYACRAGTTDDRYGEVGEIAWHYENSGYDIHPVGEKRANAFGLHDMLGNVRQWCRDWCGDYSETSAIDPKGPRRGVYRTIRGSSWRNKAETVRASKRGYDDPFFRGDTLGFRLAFREE